jgi:transcriptional regulator with XRE-family HTH domain
MVGVRKEQPDSVDISVGRQVRALRQARRLSMEQLASQIGVTYQQVQKYESGLNRISASMLARIARILDVRIGDFFPEEDGSQPTEANPADHQCLAIARKIGLLDPHLRRSIHDLVDALAAARS